MELLVTGMVTRETGIWLADAVDNTATEGKEDGEASTVVQARGLTGRIIGQRFQASSVGLSATNHMGALKWPAALRPLLPRAIARKIAAQCDADARALRDSTLSLFHTPCGDGALSSPKSPALRPRDETVTCSPAVSSPNVLRNGVNTAPTKNVAPGSPPLRSFFAVPVVAPRALATEPTTFCDDSRVMIHMPAPTSPIESSASRLTGGDVMGADADDDDEEEEDEDEDDDEEGGGDDWGSRNSFAKTGGARKGSGGFPSRLSSYGDSSVGASWGRVMGSTSGSGKNSSAHTLAPSSGVVAKNAQLTSSGALSWSGASHPPRLVELTPLQHVPGANVRRYLGCITHSFVRESMAVRQGGGLSSFTERLIEEANAVVRGEAAALGGNAVLNYRIVPRESVGRVSRNAAYHLLSISGDVVELSWGQSAGHGGGVISSRGKYW